MTFWPTNAQRRLAAILAADVAGYKPNPLGYGEGMVNAGLAETSKQTVRQLDYLPWLEMPRCRAAFPRHTNLLALLGRNKGPTDGKRNERRRGEYPAIS